MRSCHYGHLVMSFPVSAAQSAAGFDWGNFWAALGALAGVLALVGAIFAIAGYFKANPKRRLEFSVAPQRLIADSLPEGSTFRVEINGIEIRDPYLVRLSLFSNSRADIPSTAFDGAKPIRIRSEPGGALLLNEDVSGVGGISVSGGHGEGMEWAEFQINPQLIRKRSSVEVIFVTDGPPSIAVTGELVDIEIAEVTAKAARVGLRDLMGDVTFSILGLDFTLHRR